jgi:hypothetical protein
MRQRGPDDTTTSDIIRTLHINRKFTIVYPNPRGKSATDNMVRKTPGSLERQEPPPIDRRPVDVPAHVVRGLKRHLGGRSQRFPFAARHSRSVAQGEHPRVALYSERLVCFVWPRLLSGKGTPLLVSPWGATAFLGNRDDCFRLRNTIVLNEWLVLASGNDEGDSKPLVPTCERRRKVECDALSKCF